MGHCVNSLRHVKVFTWCFALRELRLTALYYQIWHAVVAYDSQNALRQTRQSQSRSSIHCSHQAFLYRKWILITKFSFRPRVCLSASVGCFQTRVHLLFCRSKYNNHHDIRVSVYINI